MGIVMAVSGTAAYLAHLLSHLSFGYLPAAPLVGAAGCFITGSNSGYNAMFAATQAEIARSLNMNVLILVALHNVAARYSILASLGKIEMALQLAGEDATAHRAWVQRMATYALLTATVLRCCGAAVLLGIVNLVVGLFHRV